MTPDVIAGLLREATVPEHSVRFMQAMSGGEPFLEGGFLFFSAADWLLAIGYPFEGDYTPETFEQALDAALRRTRAQACWAICPALPERLKPCRCEQDRY
ncbi:MAG: GNAT family N-acetyltransferase, partial [Desulfobacterales bacterium]|nr:GNAT family N-acetyltransferase [Desulfobacterales bacterium]